MEPAATTRHAEKLATLLVDQDMYICFASVRFYAKLGHGAGTLHVDAVRAQLVHQDALVHAAVCEALRKMGKLGPLRGLTS